MPQSGKPRQLVVILHGYGADGEDLIGLAQPFSAALPDAMFAAPNAPARCGQNPFGYEWFPIDFEAMGESKRIGVPLARQAVVDYLADAWARTSLGPADTVLAGFSQGAMMALHVGLSLPDAVRGIVAFSGALVPPAALGRVRPPVCLVHGDSDTVVDPGLSRQAAEVLAAAGIEASLHLSPGVGHGISPDGLAVATTFLSARFAVAND